MWMMIIPLTLWLLLHSQAYVSQPKVLVLKIQLCWNMMVCHWLCSSQCFEGPQCLHRCGQAVQRESLFLDCLAAMIKVTQSLQKLETMCPYPKLMPTSSAISLIVKRRFWRIKSWTALMWMSSVDVEGRPLRGSLSIDILPVLKWLYHSKHCVRLIHSSLKACWNIFHVSVAVFPSLKQNFTHTHCSSKSFIFTA